MSVLRAHKGWKAMCVTFDVSGWCSNSRNDTVASVVGLTLYKYYVQYSPFIWEVCICRADCGQHFFQEMQRDRRPRSVYVDGCVYCSNEEGSRGRPLVLCSVFWDYYKAVMLIPAQQKCPDMKIWKDMIVNVDFKHNMKEYESYGS